MNTILTVVGARPQFIKASVVSRRLIEAGIGETILHTGQHYDFNMSEAFFKELEIPEPAYNLEVGSGGHGEMTGKMLMKIEKILLKEKPSAVIVYGDTNSTLAGALAASKLHIPVCHVEAGLRSYNRRMPEEQNRVLTDHMSSVLFCPTESAVSNLAKEGIIHREGSAPGVYNVGDVMFDVASSIKKATAGREDEICAKYGIERDNYILVTIHRADNTDNETNLRNIWDALEELSGKIPVFFPVHPRTRKYLETHGMTAKPSALILADPVTYTEMIVLESNARLVITDSGGVQKESYFFRRPVVIPRSETEWTEQVELGWNRLAGQDKKAIVSHAESLLKNAGSLPWVPLYGDGNAAKKIVEILGRFLR